MKAFSTSLLVTLMCFITTANASSCDGSHVRLENHTGTTFHINTFYARTNSHIEQLEGGSTLESTKSIEFEANSGTLSSGDAFGVVEFKGQEREFKLYYFFSNKLELGKCTSRSEIESSKYDLHEENFTFECNNDKKIQAPTIVCKIYPKQESVALTQKDGNSN